MVEDVKDKPGEIPKRFSVKPNECFFTLMTLFGGVGVTDFEHPSVIRSFLNKSLNLSFFRICWMVHTIFYIVPKFPS